ncbi:MAG: signal peptidase II [Bacteroidota bacterium]
MRNKGLLIFLIVALILIIDQSVKIYIKTNFFPGEDHAVIGDWMHIHYTENQGMAFGTTFGSSIWAKLALSIFRMVAIAGIIWYIIQKLKENVRVEFLIALGLVLAGAAGNLIDSMAYDYLFTYDPCMVFNHLEGSGIKTDCGIFGDIETRHTGFLFGNVVDMFRFQFYWPQWMPWLGGREVFPAIFNVADASISCGVIMVLIRQRSYFAKKETQAELANTPVAEDAEPTKDSEE